LIISFKSTTLVLYMETPQYFVWVIHIPWYRLLSYFSDSLAKKFIFIGILRIIL